ncbi:DegT/DnrJ/EryC1/StrS family aminotransferase [Maribellus sediminis]|uniref:DegT/DnrJ/EryC1/StrS family aminotransferase n=1 Tax=Maribellus sediminis TaxID=2696285 RepID=UPI00143042AC|nr:DegT/DnrJ/EryC1/StrS family aminotransferase [Maribellus sediminis]
MKIIHFSDLYGEYLTMKQEIDEAIAEVIRSTHFVKSGKVLKFESELGKYLTTNVIACGNGTDALQIAFMALDLQPGDEVITTPFTFVSTVETAALIGLKPVFADADPDSFNIDVSQIEKRITPRTKAIIPVHLFGQCANMEAILALAKKHGLFVIEDACQALGTDYHFSDGRKQKAGTIGDIGCNSFFPSKNLGAFGDGGAIFTGDDELSVKIRSIANHGMKAKYEYERIGVNSRLDSIQAAILGVKLLYLDQKIVKLQKSAAFYDEMLTGIGDLRLPARMSYSTHTLHQYTIQTEKRDELQEFLKSKGIPSMVYYPTPLHLQKAYLYLGYREGEFPVSEKLSQTVLSLPLHPELEEDQIEYIVSIIMQFYRQY